jgi:hypothetical protein
MPRTWHRMTDETLLGLLAAGTYTVDADTGRVYARGDARPLSTFGAKRRRFVRLHHDRTRRGIAVARLVWVSVARCPVPPGFEVHHRDEDSGNDAWTNLICLHKLDHQKVHAGRAEEPVPF